MRGQSRKEIEVAIASHQGKAKKNVPRTISMVLNADEVRTLGALADYYSRSMGPFRHVVRLTTSRAMRQRFAFVAEEGKWLSRYVASVETEMAQAAAVNWQVAFTPRTLFAFWGRLLSSLRSKRSRRKLSAPEVELRESLATRFCDEARQLERSHPDLVAAEIETRRTIEQGWMREELLSARSPLPQSART